MWWLSNDGKTRCSRRLVRGCSPPAAAAAGATSAPSLSVPPETDSPPPTWRSRGSRSQTTTTTTTDGLTRSAGSVVVVPAAALLFLGIVVVLVAMVRCDDDASSLLTPRHSPAAESNRNGVRARRRHPPTIAHRRPPPPSYDRRHLAAQAALVVIGDGDVIRVSSTTDDDVIREKTSSSSSSIVLPVETLSKSGSGCSRRGDCADPENGLPTPPSAAAASAEERSNFTLTGIGRRSRTKENLIGNTDQDSSSDDDDDDDDDDDVRPSQTPCLNSDSVASVSVSAVCSTPDQPHRRRRRRRRSRSFTFGFCTHLRSADAVAATRTAVDEPRPGDGDGLCWPEDGATEAECRRCVAQLTAWDEEAKAMYDRFDEVLSKFDCKDRYSTASRCSDCKTAYRHWACSVTIPHYNEGGERIEPCSHYGDMVEQRCPYLSPHSLYQYAGEPVFLGIHTKFEETNLRLCHYLCRDHSINPQTEDRYAISSSSSSSSSSRRQSDCSSSNASSSVCILTVGEHRGNGEPTETVEVSAPLSSRVVLETSSSEQTRPAPGASVVDARGVATTIDDSRSGGGRGGDFGLR